MKVWIVAKTLHHNDRVAHVYGLTETGQHLRLRRANGAFPLAGTAFAVGQVWDLTFHPYPDCRAPFAEDVVVTQWKQFAPEENLREIVLARVHPWVGGPEQLFDGKLKMTMEQRKPFLSQRDVAPSFSMGYWLPDAPLTKWHDKEGYPCYRYYTPQSEAFLNFAGEEKEMVFLLPAQTLLHVVLRYWWKPENKLAKDANSRVEERCYLALTGWYT